MKRWIALFGILILMLSAASCGQVDELILVADDVLSPVAIYSMAENVVQEPAKYDGKKVQAEGMAYYSPDLPSGYAVRISDSTACCYVDLEYTLPEGTKQPEDQSYFQIFGTFKTYQTQDGSTAIRIEGTRVIYEDELREMYETEE